MAIVNVVVRRLAVAYYLLWHKSTVGINMQATSSL